MVQAAWSLEHGMMVRRIGAGPEVVWIHGLGEWSVSFDPIVAAPMLAGFTHVLIDLPGYGRSPWPPPDQVVGLDAIADQLAAWLGDRRPALVGHSMGGVLATLVAERVPVRAVVDCEGNLSSGDCIFSAKAAAYTLDGFVARGLADLRASVFEGGLQDLELRNYHAAMSAAQPQSFHRHANDLMTLSATEQLAPRLAAIAAPSLFIAGVPDGICARSRALLDEHAVRWLALSPSGHVVFFDQSTLFAAAVGDFLRETLGG